MSRRYAALAVALPLCAIVLGIVRAELFMRRARDFVFEIGGYDPRDLLRGHYLQFRLQVEPGPEREACDESAGDRCCLCLTRAEPGAVSPAVRATCATARATCDGALETGYLAEALRYYVPEQQAADLDERLRAAMAHRGARAVLAIEAEGRASVRELWIDGEPVPGGLAR